MLELKKFLLLLATFNLCSVHFGNCALTPDPYSCLDKCSTSTKFNSNAKCQCNEKCAKYGDCCPDYTTQCLTCYGRGRDAIRAACDMTFDRDLPCQCNYPKCEEHDDCCEDAEDVCKRRRSATVTDVELANLSEDLLANDVNNVAGLVTVNTQGSTCYSCTRDAAPQPLLSVGAEAYAKPTIAKLLPLHNNYLPAAGTAEAVTSAEIQEEINFLDAALATPVMKKTEKFLTDKNFLPRSSPRSNTNNNKFRDTLQQIWFGLYSRENRTLGSSGFEHVFLGEVKDGKVSGFHNWIYFSKEEANNKLNYKGRIGTPVNLGAKGRIIKHKFDWESKEKPISSMFVGTSPEFEMALYTLCYYARPGARCPVKLGGKNVVIQTYFMNRMGKRYVASAFPDI